jgi:hypothetical protein
MRAAPGGGFGGACSRGRVASTWGVESSSCAVVRGLVFWGGERGRRIVSLAWAAMGVEKGAAEVR